MMERKHIKARIRSAWTTAGAVAALVASGSAAAVVPTPPAPSTAPATNDAISWVEGVFEDASEVGILAIGVILFVLGAAGMIWAISQIMTGKESIAGVAKIGVASAGGIAFGTYALTQASGII